MLIVLGYVKPEKPVAFPPAPPLLGLPLAPPLNDSGSNVIHGVQSIMLFTVADIVTD